MKAKRSALLSLSLLLLTMLAVWSQTSDKPRPTCPAVTEEFLQSALEPTAWVKANWNATTKLWDIQCSEIDSLANMPAAGAMNAEYVNANHRPGYRKTPVIPRANRP